MNIKRALIIHSLLLLAACSAENGDDLDQFMREAGKNLPGRIEPLPEVKPYVPLEYNADNSLANPFKIRKTQSTGSSSLQPNLNRPKEALETFPLESLKFVGAIFKAKLKYALIKAPDNSIQQAKVGNYIGQNFGIITEITESGITIKEVVQDELSGDWVERSASVNLQE
ncbi:MAG: pilus assembly protein PilP [Methylophilaceae bacterium]